MKRTALALIVIIAASAAGAGAACSSSSNNGGGGGGGDSGTGNETGGGDGGGSYALQVPCNDAVADIYKDPGTLPADKGAIIKCAKDSDISMADLEAAAKKGDPASVDTAYALGGPATPGYSGKPFTSGAHVYRVLYRTERGDTNNTAGYASALVFIPDTPRAPKSPLVIASHGSRGQAGKCAPSEHDPAASGVDGDFIRQVYPLVGSGYAVIAPDLAGYVNYGGANNPPSAYGDVADVGKSSLDGARAMKKLVGDSLLDKVVLVGHSQGGGTALGAFALYPTYAPELTIAAVAVYTPLWVSLRATGALLIKPSDYTSDKSAFPKVALWYYYTHGELIDGPGHGVDVFASTKRTAVKAFVDTDCWEGKDVLGLGNGDGGSPVAANDFLDPTFINDIKYVAAGIGGGTCATTSDPARCQKWMDRFVADWPHFMGAALQVPVLSLYGGQDTTITPDIAACVFGRYKADTLNYKVCFDPAASHSGIVSLQSSYVNDWIAARTLGAAEPAACPSDESALKDDAGAPVPCNPLVPPN
jgi:pimeloyl-ACP methyl ester carboxylesterase